MVALGSDASLDNVFVGGATIMAWIKPSSDGENDLGRIFDKSDATNGNDGWHLLTLAESGGSCDLRFAHAHATTIGTWNTTNTEVNIDEWTHVAVTYDNSSTDNNASYYINGKSVAVTEDSTPVGSAVDDSSKNLFIGNNTGGDRSFAGGISTASIHKTILDAQTIKQFAKSRYTPMRDNRFSVVDFDGTNDVIAMTTSSAVSPTEAITVSAWVNFTSLEDYDLVVGNTDTGSNGWRLAMDNADNIIFAINSWGSNHAETPMSSTGVWHHLVGTYDKSNIKIYLDGELKGTDSYTDSITYSSNVFQIGGASGWSNLTGSISSVAIYSDAKDADFIYAQYQKGITHNPSADTGLVGLWRMGSDTSKAYPTIADSSSNSNDGTITNGASDDIVQQMVAGYDMGAFESTGEEVGGDTLAGIGIFDTDTISSWSSVNLSSKTYDSSGFMRCVATNNSQELGVSGGTVLTVGNNYNVTFKAKSDRSVKITSIGDYQNIGTTVSNPTLTTSFQNYEFNISPTQTYFRIYMNLGGSAGDFLDLKDIRLKELLQSADLSDTYPAIIDVNEPVLGANKITSNTASEWNKYSEDGTGDLNDTANGVALTAGSDTRNSYRFVSGLTDGKLYKLNVDAYYSGSSDTVKIEIIAGSGSLFTPALTTTSTNYTIYFVKNSGTMYILGHGFNNGNVLYVENLTVKEIQGNVGTMTQMEGVSNLVYSSVLPDQSFLYRGKLCV